MPPGKYKQKLSADLQVQWRWLRWYLLIYWLRRRSFLIKIYSDYMEHCIWNNLQNKYCFHWLFVTKIHWLCDINVVDIVDFLGISLRNTLIITLIELCVSIERCVVWRVTWRYRNCWCKCSLGELTYFIRLHTVGRDLISTLLWWGSSRPRERHHYRKSYWARGIWKCLLCGVPLCEWVVDQYNLRRAHATCQGFMIVITWLIICLSSKDSSRSRKRRRRTVNLTRSLVGISCTQNGSK